MTSNLPQSLGKNVPVIRIGNGQWGQGPRETFMTSLLLTYGLDTAISALGGSVFFSSTGTAFALGWLSAGILSRKYYLINGHRYHGGDLDLFPAHK